MQSGDLALDRQGRPLRRVLVPVKSLAASTEALDAAVRFVQPGDGRLRLVHVRRWDPPTPGGPRYYRETSEEATSALDAAMRYVWNLGADASGVVVEAAASRIASALLVEALQWGADVVVVDRRSGRALLAGPWDRAVGRMLRSSPCPILVVGPGGR